MALSSRGIKGLEACLPGLADEILLHATPMQGRMVHMANGKQEGQAYDAHGRSINSIDRQLLSEVLISAAERHPNVKVFFDHKLIRYDCKTKNVLIFETESGLVTEEADLVIGADGAHSVVRKGMMRLSRMDYSQKYIDCDWCELSIPAGEFDGKKYFKISPNWLHIWPRKKFLFIALPNEDMSFTCTLFMPPSMFSSIKTGELAVAFFKKHFQDALELIGENELRKQYMQNSKNTLMTLNCSPLYAKDKCILVGDAAHSKCRIYVVIAQFFFSFFFFFFFFCVYTNYSNGTVLWTRDECWF